MEQTPKPLMIHVCDGKKRFDSWEQAHAHIDDLDAIPDSLKTRHKRSVVFCKHCQVWHLGPIRR